MYSVINVAEHIIMYYNRMNKTISNLKLQKILYFVQAEFLVSKDEPCFEERIEAWDFEPVIPEVYHKYKVFGGASIPHVEKEYVSPFKPNDQELIEGIVKECAKYSASTLVEITHRQTPWQEVYSPHCIGIITNESIKRFFKENKQKKY